MSGTSPTIVGFSACDFSHLAKSTVPGKGVIMTNCAKVTPAFWASLAFSLLGAVALLAVAPLAAHFCRSSKLFGLLAVLALSLPISALGNVPSA